MESKSHVEMCNIFGMSFLHGSHFFLISRVPAQASLHGAELDYIVIIISLEIVEIEECYWDMVFLKLDLDILNCLLHWES